MPHRGVEARRLDFVLGDLIGEGCERDSAAAEVWRSVDAPFVLAEVQRRIVTAPGIVHAAVVAGKMPAEEEKMMAFGIALEHSAGLHRQAAADLDIREFMAAGGQGAPPALSRNRRHSKHAAILDQDLHCPGRDVS